MKQIQKFSAILLLAVIVFTGCKKDNDLLSSSSSSLLYDDAAESISTAMGDESGGAVESFADVLSVAGGGSFSTTLAKSSGDEMITAGTPVYDSLSGWWTVTIDRSKSGMQMSGFVKRIYQYQFSKNGIIQKLRVTSTDTATTVKFKIIDGSGYFSNLRMKHYLTKVHGGWTVTDLNKDTVTLNSDTVYVRTGVDTIITRNMVRTFDHTLRITKMTDVRGPRFRLNRDNFTIWRNNFSKAISGTVEGTFYASITFSNGDLYKERTIDKTFTITLGGGEGSIGFGGDGRKFGCDLGIGERKP
jgi:hypothetical protein